MRSKLVSKVLRDMPPAARRFDLLRNILGVGVVKEPVNTASIVIDSIGELTNEFRI